MKDKMKKLLSSCFDKWWILPLFSVILIGLLFIFDNIWLLFLGLLLITASVIYQFIKKGWKLGCLTGTIMFVLLCISAFWFISQIISPNPENIHRQYSKRYENRTEIQKIIGVEIPKFNVVNSRLVHLNDFDFEFEVQSTIEFKALPDDKFFYMLDSISTLPIPQEPNENSSFFYYGLENVYRCWSKDGNKYKYERNTDFGEQFLHSKDAYFNFEMTKGLKTAEISYGNY